MPPPDDWTDGPAKRLAVFILGAVVVTGLAYSMIRASRPWRDVAQAEATAPSRMGQLDESAEADRDDCANAGAGDVAAPGPAAPPPTPAAVQPPTAAAATAAAKPAAAVRININTANKAELELLPGIGPSLAQRILDERARGGAFKSADDLGRVRGIGPRTIQRLREHVRTE